MAIKFHNRTQVGQLLADQLRARYGNRSDVIVLGLPRGGVPIAFEIAQALKAPLDVCLVRKLGVPGQIELAMGAIALGGIKVMNESVVRSLDISPDEIQRVIAIEQQELHRRDRLYRADLSSASLPDLRDRIVILVDDGIATGATLRAALATVRHQHPAQIVVAVPVAAPSICEALRAEVDDMICLVTPDNLSSISLWYDDFSQTTDAEVRGLLAQATQRSLTGRL